MKHVMAARAVAWQVDLDANKRIRVVKSVELQARLSRLSTPAHHAVSALV